MRGAAEREMGDLTAAGDAPFGGEVAVDSQVRCWQCSVASESRFAIPWPHSFPEPAATLGKLCPSHAISLLL